MLCEMKLFWRKHTNSNPRFVRQTATEGGARASAYIFRNARSASYLTLELPKIVFAV